MRFFYTPMVILQIKLLLLIWIRQKQKLHKKQTHDVKCHTHNQNLVCYVSNPNTTHTFNYISPDTNLYAK